MESIAKVIPLLLRLILGGIFVYAGLTKVMNPGDFAKDILHYHLIPWPAAAAALAVYLPWFEIFCGLGILLRRLYDGALMAVSGMMLVFTGALASAWFRGLDIACGCFGKTKVDIQTHFPALMARDLTLLAIAVVLLAQVFRKGTAASSV